VSDIDDLIAASRSPAAARPGAAGPPAVPAGSAAIFCDRLVRIFSVSGVETQALQGLDLQVQAGEVTALVGASGSGKSTLLNILAALDRPTGGQAVVAGHDLLTMGAGERLAYRRSTVGFIWQQTIRNLLPHLTAAENITLPMRLARAGRAVRRQRPAELLELLDLGDCADRVVGGLSGGQQQRVAIGVALANRPRVLLADEPTGELDSQTAAEVFAAIGTANSELGVTVLIVTHDDMVSAHVRRTIAIRDGRISTEVVRRAQTGADGREALVSREYSVLDRAGRLQLPGEFISHLGLRDRVRLALEPDHVGVWPDTDDQHWQERDRPADPAAAREGPADKDPPADGTPGRAAGGEPS
jgi:ABC-type lipoprotein export system ATPase subunit